MIDDDDPRKYSHRYHDDSDGMFIGFLLVLGAAIILMVIF